MALAGEDLLSGVSAAETVAECAPGKDKRLFVHTAFPAVLETPVPLLGEKFVTPLELLFVRNNQQLKKSATLEPLPLKGWKLELGGLIDKPRVVDAEEIASLPTVTREMVLQCSGNGRAIFSKTAQVKGTQWGRGAIGNVRFTGVSLSSVLKHFKLKVKPEAKYLLAQGKDDPLPKKVDFEHSLPLRDALDHSLIALKINGKPLPAIHGGPLRLITPGYYATVHLKWLSRLSFERGESTNYNHVTRYRTPLTPIKPGTDFKATLRNSHPTWRMKIATMIFTPTNGQKLTSNQVTVHGATFNDGAAKITTVLVSTDQGRTWKGARLQRPKSPFAWTWWKISLRLKKGRHPIWARAVDALGRSQPLDGAIYWNPRGYEWNGVEKLTVEVT